MQFVSLHTNLKSVQDAIENAKEKHKILFDERLPALTMLNMEKNLKEESKMVLRMDKVEARVDTVEGTLKTILDQSTHTNNLLQNMLEAQLQP